MTLEEIMESIGANEEKMKPIREEAERSIRELREINKTMPSDMRMLMDSLPYVMLKSCKTMEDVEDRFIASTIMTMIATKCLSPEGIKGAASCLLNLVYSYRGSLELIHRLGSKEKV